MKKTFNGKKIWEKSKQTNYTHMLTTSQMQSCQKLSVKKLGRCIKLIARSHINVEEYFIKANVTDDVEQTTLYLDLSRARNLVKRRRKNQAMSLIKSRTPENTSGDASDVNDKDDDTEGSEIA